MPIVWIWDRVGTACPLLPATLKVKRATGTTPVGGVDEVEKLSHEIVPGTEAFTVRLLICAGAGEVLLW